MSSKNDGRENVRGKLVNWFSSAILFFRLLCNHASSFDRSRLRVGSGLKKLKRSEKIMGKWSGISFVCTLTHDLFIQMCDNILTADRLAQ